MDINLALMAGVDIPVPECQLVLHQPSIAEIAFIGDDTLLSGLYTLNLKKSMFVGVESATNFYIFSTIMADKESADKRKAVLQVLQLVCPQYKAQILPRSLVFLKDDAPPVMIDDNNFEALQTALTKIFCLNSSSGSGVFNPADAKAKAIADKLMRGRQRIAAERNKSSTHVSIYAQYVSVLTVGIRSMTLKDCLDLTVYQLYDLLERYALYMEWDIDIRSRLAGAKAESKPGNWMKNIH